MQNSILFGAAYYPETWDESERPHDIKMMKEAGMNVMRIAEFAWHKMEPEYGKYDFKWLHDVIDDLAANGIKTILGTPTATPPRWFLKKYPDAAKIFKSSGRAIHGGRRHICSSNPDYIRESARIVEAMAREFGSDPNVIGWQLDNEIYSSMSCCYCEHCVKRFHNHLKSVYGTVENLNRAWALELFSQAYDCFEDVPAPIKGWQSPHMKMMWTQSHRLADIEFIHMQNDILKKYTKAPIGTDMMPLNGMSYPLMTAPLDVLQFNHYNTEENLNDLPFWFDYLRTFDKPFWNTETSTGWNGSEATTQVAKAPGFCHINSWLPIALGGSANLYWLWRQHRAGHELIHGSVIYANGKPLPMFDEVRQLSRDFEKAESFLNDTKVKTDIAMHFSSTAEQIFETQAPVIDFQYRHQLIDNVYLPLTSLGVRPDVIPTEKALDNYKVVFSPLTITLEENGLPPRIEKWVRDGGTWVAGPMTDIRKVDGTHYTDASTSLIERLTGAELKAALPDSSIYVKSEKKDGTPFEAKPWQELYAPVGDVYASVTDGYESVKGLATVQKIKVGKGCVWIIGALTNEDEMKALMKAILADAGIKMPKVTGALTVIEREGNARQGLILMEVCHKSATYTLDRPMTDILTGKAYSGEITLNPYDILILE